MEVVYDILTQADGDSFHISETAFWESGAWFLVNRCQKSKISNAVYFWPEVFAISSSCQALKAFAGGKLCAGEAFQSMWDMWWTLCVIYSSACSIHSLMGLSLTYGIICSKRTCACGERGRNGDASVFALWRTVSKIWDFLLEYWYVNVRSNFFSDSAHSRFWILYAT